MSYHSQFHNKWRVVFLANCSHSPCGDFKWRKTCKKCSWQQFSSPSYLTKPKTESWTTHSRLSNVMRFSWIVLFWDFTPGCHVWMFPHPPNATCTEMSCYYQNWLSIYLCMDDIPCFFVKKKKKGSGNLSYIDRNLKISERCQNCSQSFQNCVSVHCTTKNLYHIYILPFHN